jgi:nuclear pore complex protein Nup93
VQPDVDKKGRVIERTAADILRYYERMNRAAGKDHDAVTRLLRIRAVDAKNAGRAEVAPDVSFGLRVVFFYSLIPLRQIMESTDPIPLDGDVAKITRRAEEFKDLHEALQRNLQMYLLLTMAALASVYQKVKANCCCRCYPTNGILYFLHSRVIWHTDVGVS